MADPGFSGTGISKGERFNLNAGDSQGWTNQSRDLPPHNSDEFYEHAGEDELGRFRTNQFKDGQLRRA
jgi:hypothetical protein